MKKEKEVKEKLRNEQALARIKVLINEYYSDIGREIIADTDSARMNLIEAIEWIIEHTEIPNNFLIPEKLRFDNMSEEEKENFWI